MDYTGDIKDTVAEPYLKRSIDVIKEIDDKEFGVYIAKANKNSSNVFGYVVNI